MARLGFIGFGVIGAAMVKRLLNKGHTVTGYNRTRAKAEPAIAMGMQWANSPREVTAASDVVLTTVTNSDAVMKIAEGPDGILAGLTAGKLLVEMSTISPIVSRELAARVREKGGDMVDAPISGSPATIEQGKVAFMVGGRRDTFDRVKPVLEDIGPTVTYVGENGLAVSMKIAINLSLAVQMLAFSESMVLAEKSGISRQTALDVYLRSVAASPMIQYRGPFVVNPPKEAWFDVNMMQKDVQLALELGRQIGVPLPTTAQVNEILTAARGMGLEKEDMAIMFNVIATLSGVKA
jgi:3-hydroxyisobutyrate dehydrogenase-like beta-hydroxyacid dehydrogenase